MIYRGEIIIDLLSNTYSNPACKLGRMVENGEILRIKRGLYETDPNTPPYLLAEHVYGPSYISFEYALSWYDIIPEMAVRVTSATCNKHRSKSFETPLGSFVYYDVPERAFDTGIEILEQDGHEFRMASPEKAVCDMLYRLPPTRSIVGLETLMYDDMRFDEGWIEGLDRAVIGHYKDLYRCTNVRMLSNYLR